MRTVPLTEQELSRWLNKIPALSDKNWRIFRLLMIATEQYLGWISATASEISAHGSAYGIHAVQVRGEPQQARSPSLLVQFCSLKWSGILTCFFTTSSWCSTWSHGRSFMTIIPCWQEDHGKVDQASQTKWLFQKRLNREKKKTSSVVSRI